MGYQPLLPQKLKRKRKILTLAELWQEILIWWNWRMKK